MSDAAGVRPSAWQWDLRRRAIDLGVLVIAVIVVAVLVSLGAPALAWALTLGPILVTFLAATWVVNLHYLRAVKAENAAGYSTVYDFAGFALRDGRTLEELRPADEDPEQPGRRSLLAGMLQTLTRGRTP